MKIHTIILLSLSLLFIHCKQTTQVTGDKAITDFATDLFVQHIDSAHLAGGAIKVVMNNKVLLDTSYGFASLELSAPMPDVPIFEIGSVTKQFTAAAILKLVGQSKIALLDDFTDYMDYDTKGRKVTIGQLLNHTSGIPSYTEIPEFWQLAIHSYPRDTLVRLIEQNEFLFEPGEALIYNNSAYYFLGLIIEKVSGMSYEDFLQDQFFSPLGMNNTHYCSTSKIVKNKVYGYGYSPDGLMQKQYLDHTWPYAAGSLCSTTEDLYKWMKAVHEEDLLGEALYKLLTEPQTLNDGTAIRYASGVGNFSNFGHRTIAHGGGINGFLSDTRYFPDSNLYIICLVNTTGPNGAGYFANEITWQLLDKKSYPTVDLDIDPDSVTGKYTGQVRGRTFTVEVSNSSEGLTLIKDDNVTHLDNYIGNQTWMDDNSIIIIKDGIYRSDDVYGHYLLEKEKAE